MSIEIVLYPPKVGREPLCKFLKECGFDPCEHLWSWPQGTKHYHWFSQVGFESFDGVEATVYPVKDSERELFPDSKWALHTRTRAAASTIDRKRQNAVIRSARKKFGGSFYNDWYGRNRYSPAEPDRRDAVARGIYLSYEHVRERVSALKFALPKPFESMEKLRGTKSEVLETFDPHRVLYNALVPFAVAAAEHFFSQCFKILLAYDEKAQQHLLEQKRKLELRDVIAIQNGQQTLEDVVAGWYSFQSISSIHQAFKQWFDIDFWSVVRRRKKVGNRLPILEKKFQQLIEFRHGLVHRFDLDLELKKENLEEILNLVMVLIDEFVTYLEKTRKVPIRD